MTADESAGYLHLVGLKQDHRHPHPPHPARISTLPDSVIYGCSQQPPSVQLKLRLASRGPVHHPLAGAGVAALPPSPDPPCGSAESGFPGKSPQISSVRYFIPQPLDSSICSEQRFKSRNRALSALTRRLAIDPERQSRILQKKSYLLVPARRKSLFGWAGLREEEG